MIYKQIKDKIYNKYISNSNKSELLPSERNLSEEMSVSRPTIRKALESLENEKLITKNQGRGYTINKALVNSDKYVDHELGSFIGFFEDANLQQKTTSSKVLQQSVEKANSYIAKQLDISKNDSIFVLSRIRFIDDIPICIAKSCIPLKFNQGLVNIDFSKKSLFSVLKENGLHLHKAKRSIEVIQLESPDYLYLNLSKKDPILKFTSVGFTDKEVPFEYEESRYPAFKVRFESTVK